MYHELVETSKEFMRVVTPINPARLLEIARDNKADAAKFREDLLNIAKTTLSSKILTQGGCLVGA